MTMIASLKLTIALVALLSVVVIGGTFYQVDHGVYAAQKRFFGSWFFFELVLLPLPGVKTIISLLAINLLAAGARLFSCRIEKIGILLIHVGIGLLIVGAGFAAVMISESSITLNEGEKASFAFRNHAWQIAFYKKSKGNYHSAGTREVAGLKKGQTLDFTETGLTLKVLESYTNCSAIGSYPHAIESLQNKAPEKDGNNTPGVILAVSYGLPGNAPASEMVLYSGSSVPSLFVANNDTLMGMLQPVLVPLPLSVQLVKFSKENHPGTENAKSYQSHVHVKNDKIDRDAVISMNHPFRYKSVSFYQTGFSEHDGKIASTFSVVSNPVRSVPYFSSILVILGLLYHCAYMLLNSLKKRDKPEC